VDPLDWTTKNTSQVVQNVLGEVESGDIILLHDCYDSSVEAAFQIIDELKRQGYEFRTVDEMILE
jgi:peptidoglycan/xylan/chitin deacetylase (PgdA/CDA1 family)